MREIRASYKVGGGSKRDKRRKATAYHYGRGPYHRAACIMSAANSWRRCGLLAAAWQNLTSTRLHASGTAWLGSGLYQVPVSRVRRLGRRKRTAAQRQMPRRRPLGIGPQRSYLPATFSTTCTATCPGLARTSMESHGLVLSLPHLFAFLPRCRLAVLSQHALTRGRASPRPRRCALSALALATLTQGAGG